MIRHYDLFAGIGGFSLALEEVFNEETIEHVFCEWERFPTAVLRKHWPEAEYWSDIADLVAHTSSSRLEKEGPSKQAEGSRRNSKPASNANNPGREGQDLLQQGRSSDGRSRTTTIVTGGFPCQPFSAAGQRRGTSDDRYKWPEMFAVIRNTQPTWVVAENVSGLATWNEGMVLEQVCTDMESEGYEVQPFIIPAVSVNAPHRRDRIWIVAYRSVERRVDGRDNRRERPVLSDQDGHATEGKPERQGRKRRTGAVDAVIADPRRKHGGEGRGGSVRSKVQEPNRPQRKYPDWQRDWQEVAFETCNDTVDDGFPRSLDGVYPRGAYTPSKWRRDSLKAYGNAIVPQVAMQIFRAIKEAEASNE